MIRSAAQIAAAIRYHDLLELADEPDLRSTVARLTGRQLAVMQLLVRGHTHRQIGHRLGMTQDAVDQHVARARDRLGASTTAQAIYLAIKAGIL